MRRIATPDTWNAREQRISEYLALHSGKGTVSFRDVMRGAELNEMQAAYLLAKLSGRGALRYELNPRSRFGRALMHAYNNGPEALESFVHETAEE
ncbi:MAG: hypothetical protein V1659_04815 [Candidatus Woesearchaeota archaeon]